MRTKDQKRAVVQFSLFARKAKYTAQVSNQVRPLLAIGLLPACLSRFLDLNVRGYAFTLSYREAQMSVVDSRSAQVLPHV